MEGNFDKSALLRINLKAEEMWEGGKYADQYKTNSEAAKAVLENQTAQFGVEMDNPNKDRTVRVTWLKTCGIQVQDCEPNCDLQGPELESDGKDYVYDLCKKVDFSINEEKLRTGSYEMEEQVAAGQMACQKALDEWWSLMILLRAKSYSGINVAPAPYTYDPALNTTIVPANQYGVQMVAAMLLQQQMNQFNNPYYLNNSELFLAWTNAQLNAGNLDGKGDAARIAALKMYFDNFNFGRAGITEDTFMIDRGAIAFKTYNRHTDTPRELGGKVNQTRYRIPSKTLPGVFYDAYYSLSCQVPPGQTQEQIVHTWRFVTRGGIWLNPEACPVTVNGTTYSPTGVISYTKGS